MGVDTKTNTFINRQYALWRLPRDLCPEDSQKVLPGFCGCGVAENYIETNGSLECSLAGVTVNFNTQDMSLKRSYFTGPKNNRQLNLRFEKWAPNFVSGLKKREVLVPRYELVAHKPVGGPGSSGLRELLATSDTPLFKKLNENAAGLYGGYRVALYIKNKSKPKKRPRLLFKTAVDLFASIKEP